MASSMDPTCRIINDTNSQEKIGFIEGAVCTQFYQKHNHHLQFPSTEELEDCRKYGLSIMHEVSISNDLNDVKFFLDVCDADVNGTISIDSPLWPGYTPLHLAAQYSTPEVVKFLIDKGAGINTADVNGLRPLHVAFHAGQLSVSKAIACYGKVRSFNCIDKFGLSYFHIAAARGYLNLFKILLSPKHSNNVNINSQVSKDHPSYGGYTALHFAAQNGRLGILDLLLEKGADFSIQDVGGFTPLHLAYYGKRNKTVERILKEHHLNYTVNPVDCYNFSHFQIACAKKKIEVINGLINQASVDMNARVSDKSAFWPGCTSLHIAVETRDETIIELLLEEGADPNVSDVMDKTVLHYACQFRNPKLKCLTSKNFMKLIGAVSELMSIGDNKDGQENQLQIIRLLIAHNAHLNVQDKAGKTPILYVYNSEDIATLWSKSTIQTECRVEAAKELIKRGANIAIGDNKGVTLLHELVKIHEVDKFASFNRRSSIPLMKFIFKQSDMNVNAKTREGETPLWIASNKKNRVERSGLTKLLLKHGADPNIVAGKSFSTPLQNYIMHSMKADRVSDGTVEMFIKYGADPNHCLKNGKNALHIFFSKTAGKGFKQKDRLIGADLIGCLFDLKCDLNCQDSSGRTPLHYACLRSDYFGVQAFLNHGIDIDIVDNDGFTPLEYISGGLPRIYQPFPNLVTYADTLQKIGYRISEQNERIFKILKQSDRYKRDIEDYRKTNAKKLEEELKGLSNIKLDRFSSLCDVLFKSSCELVRYVKNSAFLEIISSHEFKSKFNLLIGPIKLQFRKGYARCQLLKPALKSLDFIIGFSLPTNCSERILDFLDDMSVRKLIET